MGVPEYSDFCRGLDFIDERPAHDFKLDLEAHTALSGIKGDHVVQQALKVDVVVDFIPDCSAQQNSRGRFRVAQLFNEGPEVVPSINSDATVGNKLLAVQGKKHRGGIAPGTLQAVNDAVIDSVFV